MLIMLTTSIKAAILNFDKEITANKILVLGDMFDR